MRVLVGGVGYRWLRDASLGLLAADALAREPIADGVEVRDLGYGALLVAVDLAAADPRYDRLVLVAATQRDRVPGAITRRRWVPLPLEADEVQARVREAGAGIIDVDHLLVVAEQFGALPRDVVVIEVEPFETGAGEEPSPGGARVLPQVIAAARDEALAAAAPAGRGA